MIAYRLTAAVAVALIVIGGLAGCSETNCCSLYGFKAVETNVDGPQTLGISDGDTSVKGLVIYFHGSDQTASVIKDDRKHTDFFDPLLRAGYAVVAADAEGNAYGNPASQDAYRRLITAARKTYAAGPLFYVAESMGGIAALTLLKDDKDHLVKGMVGISPLMGLPAAEADSIKYVAGPWGGKIPASADPLSWTPDTFDGRQFRLYTSKSDKVIPSAVSAQAFAEQFSSAADVVVVGCKGGHVAVDCYRGSDVVQWMSSLT